jgi:hypothetical protein
LKKFFKILGWTLLTFVVLLFGAGSLFIYKVKNGFPVTYETEKPKISIPADKPAILLFSKTTGFRHGESIDASKPVLKDLSAKNGWFIIMKRLFRRTIPVVPVLLNTYFYPNVPTSARCYDVGRKLRAVVEAMPGDQRIAIIASGGLSHFVVDEAQDLKVMQALKDKDAQTLRSIPRQGLKSGSSETLNWILTAGAVETLPLRFAEYQALYRTEAGTGVGAAFCSWRE